jgi:four helix bundle protein
VNGQINSFRDLVVWQKAMELVVAVYRVTKKFPDDEKFGLISQTRRAATSIPANIAEGYGRNSTQDYIRFLRIAYGSLNELLTHLEVARRLDHLTESDSKPVRELTGDVERLLHALIRSLER